MSTHSPFKRTRIAPTPSGYLHLGNVFSMAVTVALARHTGARVLLRIDDLDQQRVKRAYVEDIFETLDYLEIPYDEGPRNFQEYKREYSQLHRQGSYRNALQALGGSGVVFACDCSRSAVLSRHAQGLYTGFCRYRELPLDTPEVNWRLITNEHRELAVGHVNGSTVYSPLPPEMHYFVVRKKDGLPAYQLASVVDDLHFGVDLVVRGEDLWASTLAQYYLAGLVEGGDAFRRVKFWHHPLLTDSSGDKLSKSAGAMSVRYLRKQGISKTAIYRKIGELLGLDRSVNNWRELGDVVYPTTTIIQRPTTQ